jgi:LPPG:FO 2-phospho-L-lactate transferase
VGVAAAGNDSERAAARERSQVVVLAGGTGGAKLARGMLDVVGHEQLVVIANTADDIDIYGAHVSPDPDLVTFWLADRIDERGWGLRGDTFEVMGGLRELGMDVWFQLGDRDLAWCLERKRMEDEGATPTAALRILCERIGVGAAVLPMSDGVMRTVVNGLPLQEFLIRHRGQGPVRTVELRGRDGDAQPSADPSPEVLAALAAARAVIIGPSNPVISIWPILATLGDALERLRAPVVAVSPVVNGKVLKGPTDAFMTAMHVPTSAAGVTAYYERLHAGLLDGVVADEDLAPESLRDGTAALCVDTLMSDAASRARVAGEVLAFADSLVRSGPAAE